jgi:hypothetical protein
MFLLNLNKIYNSSMFNCECSLYCLNAIFIVFIQFLLFLYNFYCFYTIFIVFMQFLLFECSYTVEMQLLLLEWYFIVDFLQVMKYICNNFSFTVVNNFFIEICLFKKYIKKISSPPNQSKFTSHYHTLVARSTLIYRMNFFFKRM